MLHRFILVIIDYRYLRMQNRFCTPQNFRARATTALQFLNPETVDRTPRTRDQPVASVQNNTNTE
jgi:hypothetical protein